MEDGREPDEISVIPQLLAIIEDGVDELWSDHGSTL
jgi:hypothetical protein